MTTKNYLKAYEMKDMPDSFQQEVQDLTMGISQRLSELTEKHDPNVFLCALNFAHASFILACLVQTDESIEKGAAITAHTIYKNIHYLYEMNKKKDESE